MSFLIQPASVFDASIADLIKSHYKRDTKGRDEFLDLVALFFADVTMNGHKSTLLAPESWPKNTYNADWFFDKYRFRMPRLSGAVGQGRIMVAVNTPLSFIYPILAYTHKQYGDRPSDKEIAPLLQRAITDVQAMIKGP